MQRSILRLPVLVVTLALIAPVLAAAPVELFVATDGSDANVGSRERPFATLPRARDAVRQMKAKGGLPQGGVTVWIRGGAYRLPTALELAKEDRGTAGAPIVYRAETRGTAIISGGVVLRDWRPVTAPGVLRLIDAKAKG